MLAVGVPTVALFSAALTRAVGLSPTPSNWTLANFRTALDRPTLTALGHSLQLACVAACVLTALGALVTALERRRAGRLLGPLTMLAFAIPGSTLAVGLLVAYGRWFDGGLTLILLAYLAKFWALAHRTISGAADRVPAAEWQAARASGAGPRTAARTIWLPALTPALVGGWVLVFLAALHEVTMSSLLYSGRQPDAGGGGAEQPGTRCDRSHRGAVGGAHRAGAGRCAAGLVVGSNQNSAAADPGGDRCLVTAYSTMAFRRCAAGS